MQESRRGGCLSMMVLAIVMMPVMALKTLFKI